MTKTKLSAHEADEVIQIYFKLTGEKIKDIPKLLEVHKVLQEYLKDKIKIHV